MAILSFILLIELYKTDCYSMCLKCSPKAHVLNEILIAAVYIAEKLEMLGLGPHRPGELYF